MSPKMTAGSSKQENNGGKQLVPTDLCENLIFVHANCKMLVFVPRLLCNACLVFYHKLYQGGPHLYS